MQSLHLEHFSTAEVNRISAYCTQPDSNAHILSRPTLPGFILTSFCVRLGRYWLLLAEENLCYRSVPRNPHARCGVCGFSSHFSIGDHKRSHEKFTEPGIYTYSSSFTRTRMHMDWFFVDEIFFGGESRALWMPPCCMGWVMSTFGRIEAKKLISCRSFVIVDWFPCQGTSILPPTGAINRPGYPKTDAIRLKQICNVYVAV